jgi:hypothetical protein
VQTATRVLSAWLNEAKKWLWLRKRVIYAALLFTATIMLALLSIDPTTREWERALYIVLAVLAFALSLWLWLKQVKFVDEYIEEYEFLSFPLAEKEEPQPQPEPQPTAQPQPQPRPPVKLWCSHCGSVHVIQRDKRLYCLDCGQITRIARERVKA